MSFERGLNKSERLHMASLSKMSSKIKITKLISVAFSFEYSPDGNKTFVPPINTEGRKAVNQGHDQAFTDEIYNQNTEYDNINASH